VTITRRLLIEPIPVLAIVSGILSLTAGCTHLVQRPLNCAPDPPPIGRSAIAWQRIGGTRSVSGKVLIPGSLEAIPGATITLAPLPTGQALQQYSDASGSFRIDSVRPSRYLMSVRRIGLMAARDTVLVVQDSGLVATASLAVHKMVLDECGLMYQEVRVPWWIRN
jgi:hypothetical protein